MSSLPALTSAPRSCRYQLERNPKKSTPKAFPITKNIQEQFCRASRKAIRLLADLQPLPIAGLSRYRKCHMQHPKNISSGLAALALFTALSVSLCPPAVAQTPAPQPVPNLITSPLDN